MTAVVEVDNRSGWHVDERATSRAVAAALAAEAVAGAELGVTYVGPDEMAALNAAHRGVATATDVLSFPIDERAPVPAGVPRQLGDVVVCPAVAAQDGTPIATLLVHGVLHLLGWDHERDAGEMLRRQSELVPAAGRVDAEPA